MAEPNTSSTTGTTSTSTTGSAMRHGERSTSSASDGSQNRNGIVDKVKESATAQLTSQKDRGTDALGSVAQAVRSSTQRLRDEKHEVVAGYVDRAADQIERWAQQLREKDVDELVGDVQRIARRQPAAFVGSAFAVGLIGARFLKSSRQDDEGYGDRRYRSSAGMYGDESRRSQYGGGSTPNTAYDRGSAAVADDSGGLDAIVVDEVVISDATPTEPNSPGTSGSTGRTRRSISRQGRS